MRGKNVLVSKKSRLVEKARRKERQLGQRAVVRDRRNTRATVSLSAILPELRTLYKPERPKNSLTGNFNIRMIFEDFHDAFRTVERHWRIKTNNVRAANPEQITAILVKLCRQMRESGKRIQKW